MVGAQRVIILRDIIAVLAPVTPFPLHSSCAGSLPKTPGPVARLGLFCVMGHPKILVCGVLLLGETLRVPEYGLA